MTGVCVCARERNNFRDRRKVLGARGLTQKKKDLAEKSQTPSRHSMRAVRRKLPEPPHGGGGGGGSIVMRWLGAFETAAVHANRVHRERDKFAWRPQTRLGRQRALDYYLREFTDASVARAPQSTARRCRGKTLPHVESNEMTNVGLPRPLVRLIDRAQKQNA